MEARVVPDSPPRAGEVRIRHKAIGVNFTDVHGRRGDYAPLRALPMPLVLGMEAVGVVEALGEGAERFRVGDRVAYASVPLGAYSDGRNFPVRRVFRVPKGAWAVFHSAAGGVGVLAGQWLRSIGARPIGIVGAESKVAAARAAGYEAVFVRGRDDWPARVRELSGGGVPVVYDSVGRDTWEGSLACLAPRGHLVCFGNSSGLAPPFSVNELRDRGSLALTWVRLSEELFEALASGALRAPTARCLPLDEAAEAHRLLESGATTGPLVLLPTTIPAC